MNNKTARVLRKLARLSMSYQEKTLPDDDDVKVEFYRTYNRQRRMVFRDLKKQWTKVPRPERGKAMENMQAIITKYLAALEPTS
jgi:hypothetical protein